MLSVILFFPTLSAFDLPICSPRFRSAFTGIVWAVLATWGWAQPQPGDVYREIILTPSGDDWRVTHPEATNDGAREFLPNPILRMEVPSLQHAVRAEVMLDLWGGHLRTQDRRLRFNSNDWIDIDRPIGADGSPLNGLYYTQHNPLIEIPLAHLSEGSNTLEGTCNHQFANGWGQWGWFGIMLRIYYDPALVDAPRGEISQPIMGATLPENPTVQITAVNPTAVDRVDVVAWYDGFDVDGDGVWAEWQEAWFSQSRGQSPSLAEHVGTVGDPNLPLIWDTHWVPDQPAGSVKLVARIRGSNGLWQVTPIVEGLTLERDLYSVIHHRVAELPLAFGVRANALQPRASLIPLQDGQDIRRAVEVGLHFRTWNAWDGFHEPFEFNGTPFPNLGKNHHYDHQVRSLPLSTLSAGTNEFLIRSGTQQHALEVLAPGPALSVRYLKSSAVRETRLTNLSARTRAGRGEDSLVLGAVLKGGGEHRVLVRGIGPGLAEFGLADVIPDPSLRLFKDHELRAENVIWYSGDAVEALSQATERLGAFSLQPTNPDSALLVELSEGSYTAHVESNSGNGGVALAEIYDDNTQPGSLVALRMTNMSVRAPVRVGEETLIAGFVISGREPLRLLLRGVGPSLSSYGVENPVNDPRLSLYAGENIIKGNDNWDRDPAIMAASSQAGAFALEDERDAAMVVTLDPGAYTLHINSDSNDEGIALIEIYELVD